MILLCRLMLVLTLALSQSGLCFVADVHKPTSSPEVFCVVNYYHTGHIHDVPSGQDKKAILDLIATCLLQPAEQDKVMQSMTTSAQIALTFHDPANDVDYVFLNNPPILFVHGPGAPDGYMHYDVTPAQYSAAHEIYIDNGGFGKECLNGDCTLDNLVTVGR